MAKTEMPAAGSKGTIDKLGHTATNAYGANPDAKRRGPGGSHRDLTLKG